MSETKNQKKVYKNYEIFQGKIRLVNNNGESVIVERDTAIEEAHKQNLDLVQIGYDKTSFPHSICKMMNYGKMIYENKKREKEAARKSRMANAEAKEVYFSIRIDYGDKNTKIRQIRKFVEEDNSKVKICVKLSKREMNLVGMAKDLMKDILSQIEDVSELDSTPDFTNGIISCVVRKIRK